jgi:hypothetical protein
MALYDEASLFSAGRDTFPLVVRLETVTDKGRREGRTLQELRWVGGLGLRLQQASRRERIDTTCGQQQASWVLRGTRGPLNAFLDPAVWLRVS